MDTEAAPDGFVGEANRKKILKARLVNSRSSVMVRQIKSAAVRLWKDERGASLLEYSVLIGLIIAGVVATITTVGTWTSGRWSLLSTTLTGSDPTPPAK